MANESRTRFVLPSRSHPIPQDDVATIASTPRTFQYETLDTSIEEIRILILHPKATNQEDELIRCSLVHKKFGKLPVFEALSYMWGDQTVAYSGVIQVNGCPFTVGYNLGCALARLQNEDDRMLWIDAVCINQNDDREKSLQIQLMRWIYKRARKCLIWLGETTPELDISVLEAHPWNETFPSKKKKARQGLSEADIVLMKHLTINPYWERVWIVQEIGSAKKSEIMYGPYLTTFSAFTSRLKCDHVFDDCIPLRLQGQLDNKYFDSHNLQYLIEIHKSNLCKEPRDHIYGFVGLSIDAQEFPIDYSKTHYEVWKDIMIFKSEKSTSPQNDILSFAALIKEKLGGTTITREEVIQDSISYSATVLSSQADQSIVSVEALRKLPGHIVIASKLAGRVIYVGPTCEEIIAFPRTTIQWESSINEHIEKNHRPQVREESELFLEKLEVLEEGSLDMIEPYHVLFAWTENPRKSSLKMKSGKKVKKQREDELPDTPYEVAVPVEQGRPIKLDMLTRSPDEALLTKNAQRLFLMENTKQQPEYTTWHDNNDVSSQGSIGILPAGAREGDYLYQVQGITQVFVVRKEQSYCCIVGTAVLAETLVNARAMREDCGQSLPFQKAEFTIIPEGESLNLYIDIAKAYLLLD